MPKVGFVGGPEAAAVFRPLGLDVAEVEDGSGAEQALERMAGGEHALVFIEEELGIGLADTIARLKRRPLPVISLVPGVRGSRGTAREAIRKMVERAVGADILFKGDS
ncbi:MAG: V-type ATP synthase subunit F [bacterium]|nr:V-type ATP synthase subunit F [bacterium]